MAPTARSPTPVSPNGGSPPPPLSKRDKRRTLIQDKLNDMLSSFNSNMRPQYDAQISAIYADLAMISRADPYANTSLDTSGEGIARMVEELRVRPVPAEGAEDDGSTAAFDNTVGNFYREFAEEVNDALEARDINVAQAVSRFEYTMQSLKTTHDHRILVAHEEHKLLSESIRSRLVQTLTTKRARLMREKEQLDISDSNSMLLHPTQFSIANPSSPGGPNHPRKTRHARHRIGDPDDPATQEGKRKRKAVFDEDRDLGGSPGPSSKNIEFGNGSPFRDAKAKTIHHQYEAPAYSIDRLFSEKELALNMNTAQTAVRHFLIKLRTAENGTNGLDPSAYDSQDITMGSARNSPAPGGDSTDETELPHPSTRAHLRGHVHGMSTRTLPTVALPPLVLPVPFTNTSKVPTAPPPQSLSNAEADEDLAIMSGTKPLSTDEKERILDHAISAGRGWEASYWGPGDGSAADHVRETSRRLVLGMEGTQDELPGRGLHIPPHLLATMDGRVTPTSNPFTTLGSGADSQAAGGGFGGVPMSRNGSAHAPIPPGGVGMRRTASGAGDSSNGHGQGEGGGRSFLGRGRGRGRGRAAANNAAD